MTGFGLVDYIVCGGMVIASGVIGLAYSIFSKNGNSQGTDTVTRNLTGNKQMSIIPVTSSLIMSVYTGMSLQSVPGEIYHNGGGLWYFLPWCFLNALINNYITLPIFYNLNMVSVYEYLEKRFDKRVRLLVSFLKLFHLITRSTLAIYSTAIVFEQVSGANTYATSAFICIFCSLYTIAGGFKAVIWSDTAQAAITLFGAIAIMVKGTIDQGGFNRVWKTNIESGSLEFPSFQLDLTARYTIWSAIIANTVNSIQPSSLAQDVVQRYLSLPTLRQAELASWFYVIGFKVCWGISSYIGFIVYATFHDCDPITTKQAKSPDDLLALLVTKALGGYPGLPGLFAATMFSLCLSTLSTGLNTAGLIVLEDFVRRKHPNLSYKKTGIVVIITTVCASAISFGLIFLVERTKLIFPFWTGLGACTAGPIVAVFLGGMLLPWMNKQGALYGGTIGFCVVAVTVFGSRFSNIKKARPTVKQPTIVGCPLQFNVTTPSATFLSTTAAADIAGESYVFPLFKLNFYWFTLYGTLVTIVSAMIISFFTGMTDLSEMDERLLVPLARKVLPKRKLQEELTPMNQNSGLNNMDGGV